MISNLVTLQSAGAEGGGAGMVNIIMIVAIVVIFYFFMIRPQQKRQKDIKKFRDALAPGSKVMTAGGIHGKIKAVRDTSYNVEIANGVVITVDKNSVYPVGNDSTLDAKPEPGKEN